MFQFPAFAPASAGDTSSMYRVTPFGNLRINSHLPIPVAYRNLLRPSSPLKATRHPPMYSYLTPLSSCSRFCMPCLVNDLSHLPPRKICNPMPVSQLSMIGVFTHPPISYRSSQLLIKNLINSPHILKTDYLSWRITDSNR